MGGGSLHPGAVPRRHRHGRHHHLRHAVHGGSFPADPAASRGAAGCLRCHGVRPFREGGGAADADRPLQHGRCRRRGDPSPQEAARRQEARRGRRLAADVHAATAAAHPPADPRHGAGRARLLPGAAILARRLAGKPRQHGAAAREPLRRGRAPQPARYRQGRAARRISRCRRVPPAPARPGRRQGRWPARRDGGERRHGRPARHALLPARQQHRALRRRHRQPGTARPAGDPGLSRAASTDARRWSSSSSRRSARSSTRSSR